MNSNDPTQAMTYNLFRIPPLIGYNKRNDFADKRSNQIEENFINIAAALFLRK